MEERGIGRHFRWIECLRGIHLIHVILNRTDSIGPYFAILFQDASCRPFRKRSASATSQRGNVLCAFSTGITSIARAKVLQSFSGGTARGGYWHPCKSSVGHIATTVNETLLNDAKWARPQGSLIPRNRPPSHTSRMPQISGKGAHPDTLWVRIRPLVSVTRNFPANSAGLPSSATKQRKTRGVASLKT